YEGAIEPKAVTPLVKAMIDFGCYECALADTIGAGGVGTTIDLLTDITKSIPASQLAVHFHDTYGQAISNLSIALQFGIRSIDSAIGGLGGCPYAKGATGNVATEDVIYMCRSLGIQTGVSLESVIELGDWLSQQLGGRTHVSRVGK